MELFLFVLMGYGYATLLFSFYFMISVLFRLDQYDWRYNKKDIWLFALLIPFVWPLLVMMKPSVLLNPRLLVPDAYGRAAQHREQVMLWTNPPPCGSEILYRQKCIENEKSFGKFLFQSSDVDNYLTAKLSTMPHLRDGQEGAILNWLGQRDVAFRQQAVVPKGWSRFEILADELIRQGKAKVLCVECHGVIPFEKLELRDDYDKPGWNYNRIYCPQSHLLISVRKLHIYIRKR